MFLVMMCHLFRVKPSPPLFAGNIRCPIKGFSCQNAVLSLLIETHLHSENLSADFIHINDLVDPPELTLIHVKGSGSADVERGISVSDYEVVVGQAIKNLRHVDRGLLKEKLIANAVGVLQNAVWHNGQRQQN
ncbi:hypothetical protein [Rhizobium leguminosarum]|uniref:hypothetical protein n=1 Tax=Rhizobium leguminosarum TaxID=384 RepID=UPI0021BC094B|nr:hypothetical protein [Rhizobium leguminosarum]